MNQTSQVDQPAEENSEDVVIVTCERPAKRRAVKEEEQLVLPVAEQIKRVHSFLETEHLRKGPLRLGRNKNTLRFHLANAENVTIGCGLSTGRKHYEDIVDKQHYQQLLASRLVYQKCARCFAVYDVPEDWELETTEPEVVECTSNASKASTSSDSEGDSSDDDMVCPKQIVRSRT
eukprot:5555620-Amphidinium_carterae.1